METDNKVRVNGVHLNTRNIKKNKTKNFISVIYVALAAIWIAIGYVGGLYYSRFIKKPEIVQASEKTESYAPKSETTEKQLEYQVVDLNNAVDSEDTVEEFINAKADTINTFLLGDYEFTYKSNGPSIIYTNNDLNDIYHNSAGYIKLCDLEDDVTEDDRYMYIVVYDRVINQNLYNDVQTSGLLKTDSKGVKYYEYLCEDPVVVNGKESDDAVIRVYPNSDKFILLSCVNTILADFDVEMSNK